MQITCGRKCLETEIIIPHRIERIAAKRKMQAIGMHHFGGVNPVLANRQKIAASIAANLRRLRAMLAEVENARVL